MGVAGGRALTEAGPVVGGQLHQVGTGAGSCSVVVDETQVRAGTFPVVSRAWVGGWRAGAEEAANR